MVDLGVGFRSNGQILKFPRIFPLNSESSQISFLNFHTKQDKDKDAQDIEDIEDKSAGDANRMMGDTNKLLRQHIDDERRHSPPTGQRFEYDQDIRYKDAIKIRDGEGERR